MFLSNQTTEYRTPLGQVDAETLSLEAAKEVERFLQFRDGHQPTPLVELKKLAGYLGVGSIYVKDEGQRLGLGSFKALGGSYAVINLVLERAAQQLGRDVDVAELNTDPVRAIARTMTVACATDGNHGRSVAQGAQLVGANCVIFVHSGVSQQRIDAIARFGATIVRVAGNYDDSVAEATRVAADKNWQTVSDTSWPGYERIPALVMQGYTALLSEVVRQMPEAPTHVFIQAGVGGIAAAVAGYFTLYYGKSRPFLTVVDPARAACIFESAKAGRPIKIEHGEPTVMAMLECYEPSLVAWRILSRCADAFMTVGEQDAIDAMRRLALPVDGDSPIVAGESGGVGLAGLQKSLRDPDVVRKIGLGPQSRVLLINTEGATDPVVYEKLVGFAPADVLAGHHRARDNQR